MESELPWHVRDYQLETRFPEDSDSVVVHEFDDPDAPPSSPPRLEHWTSERRPFGFGGQGHVFLQRCETSGAPTVRAVKEIPLGSGRGSKTHRYAQELHTNFRFSHRKVCPPEEILRCFGGLTEMPASCSTPSTS
jgi:hypothetical protein